MIKELRKHTLDETKEILSRTYYGDAEDDYTFPYQVIELKQIGGNETKLFSLEVKMWDKGTEETIDGLIDELQRKFNKFRMLYDDMLVQIDDDGIRNNLSDQDKTIKGVRAMFTVRVLERR